MLSWMLLVGGEVVLNFNKSIMKTVMKFLNLVRKTGWMQTVSDKVFLVQELCRAWVYSQTTLKAFYDSVKENCFSEGSSKLPQIQCLSHHFWKLIREHLEGIQSYFPPLFNSDFLVTAIEKWGWWKWLERTASLANI